MKSLIGKKVQFNAERIMRGNPVEGVIIHEDGEWLEVELSKDIEGMNTVWFAGEKKGFRKSLIRGEIKTIES